ncbi:MAG: hypothetical protein OM95_13120 [Bdellovibrio sp. ArHS]|uniref:hypothetical protein n=1 Tax=Bdellovibrio sp. ArHS TaxID=1569284 RepID=UPI00058317C8|nr:hypothetical protein [Bdellovibrio sp. ArHS]KHD87683.1 MAG: hypothetical protein OM95_13120 [Bdellovibrio sp. ArHS]
MLKRRQIASRVLAVILLAVSTLSFQNCANTPDSSAASALVTDTSSNVVSALAYPSTAQIVTLVPGQNITLKIQKPSAMVYASDYIWYVLSDESSLVSSYGLLVENDGYLYVSLSVRSSYTSVKSLRVYFLDTATYSYFDSTGLSFQLNPAETSPYSADAQAEVCNFWSAYTPTFLFDRTKKLAAAALTIFDNGAGVGSVSCSFGDSSSGYTTVDCLNSAAWPANWASLNLIVHATNRCGTSVTYQY